MTALEAFLRAYASENGGEDRIHAPQRRGQEKTEHELQENRLARLNARLSALGVLVEQIDGGMRSVRDKSRIAQDDGREDVAQPWTTAVKPSDGPLRPSIDASRHWGTLRGSNGSLRTSLWAASVRTLVACAATLSATYLWQCRYGVGWQLAPGLVVLMGVGGRCFYAHSISLSKCIWLSVCSAMGISLVLGLERLQEDQITILKSIFAPSWPRNISIKTGFTP